VRRAEVIEHADAVSPRRTARLARGQRALGRREDQRHLHRDLETLKQDRARTSNRSKGLLSSQGIRLASVHQLPEQLDALRLWDGSPVPSGLRGRLLRVYAHYEFLGQQIAE
jgi:transposase